MPTASAVEALLAELRPSRRPIQPGRSRSSALAPAAARGSGGAGPAARRRRAHAGHPGRRPDRAGPGRPDRRAPGPPGRRGPSAPAGCPPLLPRVDRRRLDAVSALLATGRPVPSKLWHAYEVLGPAAAGRTEVAPIDGAVGASPAATAAWLGQRGAPERAARAYLDAVVARHGGPVPCCTPITTFERSWTLATLSPGWVPVAPVARAGGGAGRRARARRARRPARGCRPTPTPPRRPCTPSPGWGTRWIRSACSTTTWAATSAPGRGRTGTRSPRTRTCWRRWAGTPGTPGTAPSGTPPGSTGLAGWLRDVQQPDGRWADRWHASPYYATVLRGAGPGRLRAVRGRRGGRRPCRGLGAGHPARRRWLGPLVDAPSRRPRTRCRCCSACAGRSGRECREAVRRALEPLCVEQTEHPPLWHDKDLYAPGADRPGGGARGPADGARGDRSAAR